MFDKRQTPYNMETERKQWKRYMNLKLESIKEKLSDLETVAQASSILIVIDKLGKFHYSFSSDLQPFTEVFMADEIHKTITDFRNSSNDFQERLRSEVQDVTSAVIPNIPTLAQRPKNRRMQRFTFPWEFEDYSNLEIMGRLSYCFSTLTQDCIKSVGPRWIDLVWKNRGVYGEARRKPQEWPLPHYNSLQRCSPQERILLLIACLKYGDLDSLTVGWKQTRYYDLLAPHYIMAHIFTMKEKLCNEPDSIFKLENVLTPCETAAPLPKNTISEYLSASHNEAIREFIERIVGVVPLQTALQPASVSTTQLGTTIPLAPAFPPTTHSPRRNCENDASLINQLITSVRPLTPIPTSLDDTPLISNQVELTRTHTADDEAVSSFHHPSTLISWNESLHDGQASLREADTLVRVRTQDLNRALGQNSQPPTIRVQSNEPRTKHCSVYQNVYDRFSRSYSQHGSDPESRSSSSERDVEMRQVGRLHVGSEIQNIVDGSVTSTVTMVVRMEEGIENCEPESRVDSGEYVEPVGSGIECEGGDSVQDGSRRRGQSKWKRKINKEMIPERNSRNEQSVVRGKRQKVAHNYSKMNSHGLL